MALRAAIQLFQKKQKWRVLPFSKLAHVNGWGGGGIPD